MTVSLPLTDKILQAAWYSPSHQSSFCSIWLVCFRHSAEGHTSEMFEDWRKLLNWQMRHDWHEVIHQTRQLRKPTPVCQQEHLIKWWAHKFPFVTALPAKPPDYDPGTFSSSCLSKEENAFEPQSSIMWVIWQKSFHNIILKSQVCVSINLGPCALGYSYCCCCYHCWLVLTISPHLFKIK